MSDSDNSLRRTASGLTSRSHANPPSVGKSTDSYNPPQHATALPKSKTVSTAGMLKVMAGSAVLGLLSWLFTTKFAALPTKTYALCSRHDQAIYTVDSHNSKVQCIVISHTRIVDSGELDAVKYRWQESMRVAYEGEGTARNYLPVIFIPHNAIVLPGMSDSHGHTLEYGASRQLPLEGAKDIPAAVARVKNFIKQNPAIEKNKSIFIEGWGWDHMSWPSEQFPTSADLDADPIIRGRPVMLQSKDGHALWVTSAALQASLPLPEIVDGGAIVRDGEGNPTGVFLDNAQDLIKKPFPSEEDLKRRFMLTVNDALSKGLTAFHDAGFDPASLAFFKRRAQEGKLPVRIYGMTYFDETAAYWGDAVPKIIDDNRLTARSVKIFADGALRSGGAALFEPYADNPETSGFMRLEPDVLYANVPKFLKDGWQVNVHAIGDRANAIVLDVFEAAAEEINVSALRPRIEHAQIMREADMKRLGKLGIIASIQPTHAVSDMWYAAERLGPERLKSLYAFRSMIDNGARITLGSDFPVEDINPLKGFYAAVTRLSPEGTSPSGEDGWFPEQRLTREEALRGITIDPAYASFTDETLGSLVPGKLADFVVLSQDIITVPFEKILETKVLATVLDGEVAYGKI